MRNKFAYSCSVKIHGSGFDEVLGSIFCLLLAVEVFFLQKVEMLEEVVVRWWEVRWIWQMRQNFVAQFLELLKHWLCCVWSGVVIEKNWALSVDECWHLINLLSIYVTCNEFTRIQEAIVDQMGSRPSNSDHDLFLVQIWLSEVLWSF